MSLYDQAQLATFPTFRERVLIATVQAAKDVAAEAPSGDQRVDDLRNSLAINILNDPEGYMDRFSWAVAANPAITYASNDGDIQFTVNSVIDAIAGV